MWDIHKTKHSYHYCSNCNCMIDECASIMHAVTAVYVQVVLMLQDRVWVISSWESRRCLIQNWTNSSQSLTRGKTTENSHEKRCPFFLDIFSNWPPTHFLNVQAVVVVGKDFSTVSGDILDFLKSISGTTYKLYPPPAGIQFIATIGFHVCRFEVLCVLLCLWESWKPSLSRDTGRKVWYS